MTRPRIENITSPDHPYVTIRVKYRSKKGHPTFYFRFRGSNTDIPAKLADGTRIKDLATCQSEARRLSSAIARGANPMPEKVTVARWVEKYLEAMKPPTNAASTVENKTQFFRTFVSYLKLRQIVQLSDVTETLIKDWHNQRKTEIKEISMRREARYLKHALSFAVDSGWLSVNPAQKLKTKKPPERIVSVLEESTTRKIIAALVKTEPETAAAWQFLAETGVRPSEMWTLTPELIDLDGQSARFVQRKTGKIKTVYFTEELAAKIRAILRRKQGKEPFFVFTMPDGSPWNRHTFRWHVYVYGAKPAGLLTLDMKNKKILSGKPPRPYLNRHTKATRLLVEDGNDVMTVSGLLGITPEILKVYAHSNEVRMKEAAIRSLEKKKTRRRA
jgi:site-specific recombinase XerD